MRYPLKMTANLAKYIATQRMRGTEKFPTPSTQPRAPHGLSRVAHEPRAPTSAAKIR